MPKSKILQAEVARAKTRKPLRQTGSYKCYNCHSNYANYVNADPTDAA